MNVFDLDTTEKFTCFDNFFKNKLLICSDYFSSPFSSFVLNNYTSMLVQQEDEKFQAQKHILLDNSLSKKDIGLFEKGDVALNTDLLFKLKNFEDYKSQAGAGNFSRAYCSQDHVLPGHRNTRFRGALVDFHSLEAQ